MKRRCFGIAALLFPLLALVVRAAPAVESRGVQVTPSTIEMGAFYGGAKVHIGGTADASSKIIILVRGPSTAEVFNKVSRVGPIWVATGKVTISGVPVLLLIFSSDPIESSLNAAAIDRYQLNFAALMKTVEIATPAPDRDRIASDFLAFKAQRGTYRISFGSVELGVAGQGELPYTLDFEMPRGAAPGEYQVTVLECRNGDVAHQSQVALKLAEVGFPALIARLAREKAALYGFISVLIAMVAGFGIDFIAARIFKRRAAAH